MKRNQAQKKTNKLPIIIFSILIALVLILGSYFGACYIENSKSIGTDWGEKYFEYLKEAIASNNKSNYGLEDGMKNTKIHFIELNRTYPAMIMTYEKDNIEYVNLYRINETNNVVNTVCKQPSTIDFLYNIEQDAYSWYLHTQTDEEDLYKLLVEVIYNPNEMLEAEYSIKEGEKVTQDTLNGEEISILKYDELFVKLDIDGSKKVDFSTDMDEKTLRANVKEAVQGYKTQEQIVTDKIKETVKEKVKKVEDVKEAMKKAREEIMQNEYEDGLKVGNVILRYGKYALDTSKQDSSMYGTIILKPDGQFHVNTNCEGNPPYEKIDCDGTYAIDRIINSSEYFYQLNFKTETGVEFSLIAYSDGTLSNQSHEYKYVGEE